MNANPTLLRTPASAVAPGPALALMSTLPALAGCPRPVVEDLARRAELRRVGRGQRLWAVGASSPGLVVVRSGAVLVRRVGGDAVVPLDLVGRGAVLGLGAGGFDAVAHEDASVLVVPRSELESWIGSHGSALGAALELAAEETGRLAARVDLLGRHGAKARLARQLLALAARFGVRDSRGTILDLRLTHRELADLIGATRETVSVAVIELRDAGVIATESRRVVVVDEPALRAVADA